MEASAGKPICGRFGLIVDKGTKRGDWKCGRVKEVYPSKDGRVRVARISTERGETTRPIVKLCLLAKAGVGIKRIDEASSGETTPGQGVSRNRK
ncbi:Putative gag-pol protein [Caligus rogercresseyi]|uniref:Gag-pol protein n=1 Tax=Caligus rogercresseyi TaxID=217165 RepID=A0A7T8QU00_CALRO|nr:Putative gag-pol protein [Caligus rogercresseyi]